MAKIVGIIHKVCGNIVKKDIVKGIEEKLKNGDIIMLNDSVWVRSLDACAEVILHKTMISLKAGMRIKFDDNYLQKNNSYEFLHLNHIKKIRDEITRENLQDKKIPIKPLDTQKLNTEKIYSFDIIKNHNFDIESTDIVNLKIDHMIKNGSLFNTDIIMYDNSTNPSFKFYGIDKKIVPKIFILGFGDFVLEEPKELNGFTNYSNNDCIFISSSSFIVAGMYALYVRFMNLDEPNFIKEIFFRLAIQFENNNIPIIKQVNKNKIVGLFKEVGSEVVLCEKKTNNQFKPLTSSRIDATGKFTINIENTDLSNKELFIRGIDVYGNASAFVTVELI